MMIDIDDSTIQSAMASEDTGFRLVLAGYCELQFQFRHGEGKRNALHKMVTTKM